MLLPPSRPAPCVSSFSHHLSVHPPIPKWPFLWLCPPQARSQRQVPRGDRPGPRTDLPPAPPPLLTPLDTRTRGLSLSFRSRCDTHLLHDLGQVLSHLRFSLSAPRWVIPPPCAPVQMITEGSAHANPGPAGWRSCLPGSCPGPQRAAALPAFALWRHRAGFFLFVPPHQALTKSPRRLIAPHSPYLAVSRDKGHRGLCKDTSRKRRAWRPHFLLTVHSRAALLGLAWDREGC